MSHSSYSKMDGHGRPVARPVSGEEQKTKRISGKIEGVKTSMKSNIAQATARGAQLRDLEDQTEQLEASGKDFLKSSGEVKKMFQWKAFLWQLGFAAIILLILSAVTLYILSATGVLNNQGRSNTVVSYVPASSVSEESVSSPSSSSSLQEDSTNTNALFSVKPGIKAFKQPDNLPKILFAAGEECSLDTSSSSPSDKQCGEGLICMAQSGSKKGVCRPRETPFSPEKLVPKSTKETSVSETKPQPEEDESSSACPKGEVACTQELVDKGTQCIIGRCIIQAVSAEKSEKSDEGASSAAKPAKGSDNKEPQASTPLTGGARVFQANGEDPSKTEAEIVEALALLHQHNAGCSVGILHKDCTLDLMMKSWGVWS